MFILLMSVLVAIKFSHNTPLNGGNNACKNFRDYQSANNNKNCFYNPDMFLKTPDLILKYADRQETHKITTEDGYILTMFRIPRADPKGTILLQHPMGANSRVYVGQGKDSLAFELWRAGYDIWLNNMRGTIYSNTHLNLSQSDSEYWKFSMDEIGIYDIPSQVKFINNMTRDFGIIFIGHSLGTTTGLIYATSRAEEAKNYVKSFIFLATACYFKFLQSPVKIIAPFEPVIKKLVNGFHLGEFYPNIAVLPNFLSILTRVFPILPLITNLAICFLTGWTPNQADPVLVNFDFARNLENFSWRIVLHYLQLMNTEDRFQMYDYGGARSNKKFYGSDSPPEYEIKKISVPILLVSSYDDSLTTVRDAELLFNRLSDDVRSRSGHLKVSGLNHFDFQVGRERWEIYLKKVVELLSHL